jgi:hypothetical protein
MNETQNRTFFFTLLFLVGGLSISTIWWILSNVILWSDGKHMEYILIPLVLGLLLTLVELEICKRKNPWNLVKLQLIVGLLGIIMVDILVYLSLNAIGPTWLNFQNPNYVNSTRWLSSDEYLMFLFGFWFAFQFIGIFPSMTCLLLFQGKDFSDYQKPWHLSWILLGILLGIRVGGTWSGIFYHAIYTLVLFPILVYLALDFIPKKTDGTLVSIPLIPLLAILFLCGFWYAIIEAQQAPSQYGNIYWFIPSLFHTIAWILLKPASQDKGKQWLILKKKALLMLWLVAEFGLIFLFMMNLFAFFAITRPIWLVLAVIGSSLALELLALLGRSKPNKFMIWSLFGMIAVFLGIIFPYAPNVFDPISSYVAVAFIIVNIFMTVPFILKVQAE